MVLLACLEAAAKIEATEERDIEDRGNKKQISLFAVGNKVLIKNPNPFQANEGTIIKVGNKRITVRLQSGSKIQQSAKNLLLIA